MKFRPEYRHASKRAAQTDMDSDVQPSDEIERKTGEKVVFLREHVAFRSAYMSCTARDYCEPMENELWEINETKGYLQILKDTRAYLNSKIAQVEGIQDKHATSSLISMTCRPDPKSASSL